MNTGEQSHQQEALLNNIPENPYEVSPGIPDLIPPLWREILQDENVCVSGDEQSVRRAGLKFYMKYRNKKGNNIFGNMNDLDPKNARISLSILLGELILSGVYKTSRVIDWINLYATISGTAYGERISNYTLPNGGTISYGSDHRKFFQDNVSYFDRIKELYKKYELGSREADLIEAYNILLTVLQNFTNQFGFNSIEIFGINARKELESTGFFIETMFGVIGWHTTAQQKNIIHAIGIENLVHFSSLRTADHTSFNSTLKRLFELEPTSIKKVREQMQKDMVPSPDNFPHYWIEGVKKLSKIICFDVMEEGKMTHIIPGQDELIASEFDETSKIIYVTFGEDNEEGCVRFCYDGKDMYEWEIMKDYNDLPCYVPLRTPYPVFSNTSAYHDYIETVVLICTFDRMARNIEARTNKTESLPSDCSLDIGLLMDTGAKIAQNPGDMEIFMSLLLSRMSPVSVDAHRHGRSRQVMQITEKSGFYHRPPAIFIRQAIGFPTQEQRVLAQRYGQKLHAYIGKVDTRTKETYERMESVKTAFDTEALQKLPLSERLEKIRELYSTNPDHISSKSITDISKTQQRGGFQTLKHKGESIGKFSFESLTNDTSLINFFYERASSLISEIESDLLGTSEDTMKSLTPEELGRYDRIGDALTLLHTHFSATEISDEGKKQSILILQNALTRINGELSREFLAKLTGFVYLFECENIRKNLETEDSVN